MKPLSSDTMSDQQVDVLWKAPRAHPSLIWREKVANWLALIGLGFFASSPALTVYLYWYAWQLGLHPNPKANPVPPDGAWGVNQELMTGIFLLWGPLLYAVSISLVSLVFKPTVRACFVIGASVLFFYYIAIPMIFLIRGD